MKINHVIKLASKNAFQPGNGNKHMCTKPTHRNENQFWVGNIDYGKAFDSVEHSSGLFTALRKIGVMKDMCILWRTFTQMQLQLSIWIMMYSNQFTLRGMRQEDTMSPKIFTAAIEEVFEKLKLEKHGVYVNGVCLTDLRFADKCCFDNISHEHGG